jgi:cytochrome b involved in lipid metabolism
MIYDLTIIGGGIAGLYTIYKYLKQNDTKETKTKKILLLESTSRLGGRVKTIHNKGQTYESGAGRFSNNHHLLLELIKEFNLESKIFPIKANKIFIDEESKSHTQIPITNQTDKALQELSLIIKQKKISDEYLLSKTLYEIAKELSPKIADILDKFYPYYSELNIMNARDGLILMERDFSNNVKYFVLGGGLEQIIDKLVNYIKKHKNVHIKLETPLADITRITKINQLNELDYYELKTFDSKIYQTKNLFLAIPSKAILSIPFFNTNTNTNNTTLIKKLLKLVSPQPLYRIYAKYKESFLDKQIITNSELSFIIPYNQEGLVMITYTDGIDTKYWLKQYLKSKENLIEKIHQKLKEIIPDIKIPELEWIDGSTSYWDSGAHYWKPRKLKEYMDPEELEDKIRHSEDLPNLWIIGEAFSNYQAWIEGSLISSSKAINELLEEEKQEKKKEEQLDQKQKKVIGGNSKNKFTLEEVSKHNKKDDAWLIINNKVYDITKWIPMHPGGMIIMKGVGKDATELFNNVGHDNYAKNKLKTLQIGILS